jgi:hypothetical protein
MKTVAFLQNQWFDDPDGVRQMLARHDHEPIVRERVRRRLIHYALFAGCLTGRRLKKAFGDLTSEIIWEEGSRVISGNSRDFHPPDSVHIGSTIREEKPDFILCFGRANKPVIESICPFSRKDVKVFYMPHPAARQSTVVQDLADGAEALRTSIKFYEMYSKAQPQGK